MILNLILGSLALLSLALTLWQWLVARRFPLHQRVAAPALSPAPRSTLHAQPPLTLLKPLKGCDPATEDSLRSWFSQQYTGPVQILFGVADAADPVCAIVNDLIARNPKCNARLVVCRKMVGANAKVAKLAELAELAGHDLLLISDADVRVPSDFLANIVAPLGPGSPGGAALLRRHSDVGLVCCFYRLANPATPAMCWEAIAINADFWSQVLQAASLKRLDFALGAVMLTRRKWVEEIGGFAALANCLADDYQLGHRLARRGHRIALCPVVVECWDEPVTWRGVWQHQLRWARTIRVCQPGPYFFSILSNATLWPALWLAVSLIVSKTLCGPLIVLALLLARMAMAQNLQRRFTPNHVLVSPFWMVPVKDLLQALIWLGAFAGNTVEWRGRRMRLQSDGTLVEEK